MCSLICLLAAGSDNLCVFMISLTKSFRFFLAPPCSAAVVAGDCSCDAVPTCSEVHGLACTVSLALTVSGGCPLMLSTSFNERWAPPFFLPLFLPPVLPAPEAPAPAIPAPVIPLPTSRHAGTPPPTGAATARFFLVASLAWLSLLHPLLAQSLNPVM